MKKFYKSIHTFFFTNKSYKIPINHFLYKSYKKPKNEFNQINQFTDIKYINKTIPLHERYETIDFSPQVST